MAKICWVIFGVIMLLCGIVATILNLTEGIITKHLNRVDGALIVTDTAIDEIGKGCIAEFNASFSGGLTTSLSRQGAAAKALSLKKECKQYTEALLEQSNPPAPPPSQQVVIKEVIMPPAPAPVLPEPSREPLREFQVLDPVRHSYQLDAREDWRTLDDIIGTAGHCIWVAANPTYKICSADNLPCGDPNGIGGTIPFPPQIDRDNYGLYVIHNGTAPGYSLIGRWGPNGKPFFMGTSFSAQIPPEANGQPLQVMANVMYPATHRAWNKGGHRISEITIQ